MTGRRWPRWLWPWRRRRDNVELKSRTDAEARLYAARRQAPLVEQAAENLEQLSDDEFARLVAQTFRRRHA